MANRKIDTQKIKRLIFVMFLPLILAGIVTAHFALKDSKSRQIECSNFITAYFCQNHSLSFYIESIYDKRGEGDNFEIIYSDEKSGWKKFLSSASVEPILLKSVDVVEVNDISENEFLRNIVGKSVNLALTKREDIKSGFYNDGILLKCIRIIRELHSEYSTANCISEGGADFVKLKFSDASTKVFSEIERSIESGTIYSYNEYLKEYAIISASYFVLFIVFLLFYIISRMALNYINTGKAN